MRSRQSSILILLSVGILAQAPAFAADDLSAPVPDPALERRLVAVRSYYTRPGDNLVKIAHLLYGHKTWWSRIKDMNPQLARLGPSDPVPVGREIKYRAPEIGERYVVQPNDWLIRIAQWKYGGIAHWSDLYHRHARQIEDPNLIRPGDVLILTSGGKISNLATGMVIAEEPPTWRKLASTAGGLYNFIQGQPYFLVGFFSGLFLLLLGPLSWLLTRVLYLREAYADLGFDPLTQKKAKKKPRRKVEEPMEYPDTFKRRPLDPYKVDRRWIPNETGFIARLPGYAAISPSRFKNFLKSRIKKSLD